MNQFPTEISTDRHDGEILAEFVQHGGQDAFAELVGRHGGIVMGVCRSVLANTQDAEDATQAVFLTLAQKAGSLTGRRTLAGWLHRVAWYVAVRAAEAATVRRRHEQEQARMRQESGGKTLADDAADGAAIPVEELHAALEKLPEKYRLPLLLHHVEGCSEAETAVLLGCTLSAASVRLSRGRAKLQARLNKRHAGISLAGTASLGAKGAAVMPSAQMTQIAQAAAAIFSGKVASVASASRMALAKGAISMLFWTKAKAAAVILAIVVLASGAGTWLVMAAGAGSPADHGADSKPVAESYVVTKLGTLGGKNGWATAINSSGQVVGLAEVDPAKPGVDHAFLYEDGKMKDLGTLGGMNSSAGGINDAMQIVGKAEVDPASPGGMPASGARAIEHAFLYENGKMSDIGTLGGPYSAATKINKIGQIVGTASLDPLAQVGNADSSHAFLFSNGKMQDLGGNAGFAMGISDGGQVLGMALMNVGGGESLQHAFSYDHGKMQFLDLPAAKLSSVRGVNEAGQIIGSMSLEDQIGDQPKMTWRAFILEKGHMQELGTLGGESSQPFGINDRGQIVGTADTAEAEAHAFLYEGGKMQDLNVLVGEGPLKAAGIKTLAQARGINARGQIVGRGKDLDGNDAAFLLTPVKMEAP